MKRGTVWKRRTAVLGSAFAVLATLLSFVLGHGRPSTAAMTFTHLEVEQAQHEVLPHRQSGLIYHWADDSPNVYVTRSMWEALSEDSRQELGRSMAIAKNRVEITIFDETLTTRIAVCAAQSGCVSAGGPRASTPR